MCFLGTSTELSFNSKRLMLTFFFFLVQLLLELNLSFPNSYNKPKERTLWPRWNILEFYGAF